MGLRNSVHTGEMKGKSTAAFGMAMRAWNQGWSVAVYQFVKSAKWKVGEEAAFRELGRLHDEQGDGSQVERTERREEHEGRLEVVSEEIASTNGSVSLGPPSRRDGARQGHRTSGRVACARRAGVPR